MKMKFLLAMMAASALVVVTGCVSKVSGGSAAGLPFVKRTVTGYYHRPVDEVFEAAKQVIAANGVLGKESILHETNLVKTAEGKINQCDVWVSVKAVEPQLTEVLVQQRTQGGGSDMDLAHEVEKQIAVKLATR
jgi:hypothetical protein